jgi:hypothetical protein
VNLEVGQASDVVTVTESAPLLKTERGEMSHLVTIDTANHAREIRGPNAWQAGYTSSRPAGFRQKR